MAVDQTQRQYLFPGYDDLGTRDNSQTLLLAVSCRKYSFN